MNNKNISRKEVKKLLTNPELFAKSEEIKKIQEITKQKETTNNPADIWTVADSSSSFSTIILNKNG